MATTAKIRFANRNASAFENAGAFIGDVKLRVAEYFESTGRSRHADWRMVLKTVLLFILTFGSYVLILSGLFSAWGMLILAIMMGAGFAGLGFSVAHDALHGAYSANPTINKLLGFTFDFTGANGYMWKITHNVIHHTYTNIDGVDEDLSVSPLLRLSPRSRYYWFHRFQHLYGFFAYGFATMNWLFAKDYQQFMKKEIGPYTNKTHPRKEIAFLIFGKLVVYTYTIIIPLLVLDIPLWQFLIGFLALHITAGMILGIIFQLAHVVEGPDFPVPDDEGKMEHAWIIHEMLTTANFAKKNKLLSWYVGGLNYQIEHHLFPQTCSIHYPAISGIVRETAEEHGVPYYDQPTLFGAMGSHYRMLKQLGQPVEGSKNRLATAA